MLNCLSFNNKTTFFSLKVYLIIIITDQHQLNCKRYKSEKLSWPSMKLIKNINGFFFFLKVISATTNLSLGQPFFDYSDGKHTILIPLEPGTNVVSYEIYESEKSDLDSCNSIQQSVIFELTRYLLIIDITKLAKESDKVYDICVYDDKGADEFTDPFVFCKEKNRFKILGRLYKQNFFDENKHYFRIAMGVGAIACIMYFLL